MVSWGNMQFGPRGVWRSVTFIVVIQLVKFPLLESGLGLGLAVCGKIDWVPVLGWCTKKDWLLCPWEPKLPWKKSGLLAGEILGRVQVERERPWDYMTREKMGSPSHLASERSPRQDYRDPQNCPPEPCAECRAERFFLGCHFLE